MDPRAVRHGTLGSTVVLFSGRRMAFGEVNGFGFPDLANGFGRTLRSASVFPPPGASYF